MFVEEIKNGIMTEFSNIKELEQTVSVTDLYPYGKTVKPPFVAIGLLNNSTVAKYETFTQETICSMPLQMTVYSGQITVNKKTLNKADSVNYLTQKIISWINKNRTNLSDVKSIRRISVSSIQPLENIGANVYTQTLRYDILAQPK